MEAEKTEELMKNKLFRMINAKIFVIKVFINDFDMFLSYKSCS